MKPTGDVPKIKVGFFLDAIPDVDCSAILEGNPGLGGTKYLFLQIAQLLHIRNNGIEVVLFTPSHGRFPAGLNVQYVSGFPACAAQAGRDGLDYLVYWPYGEGGMVDAAFCHQLPGHVKLIPWCHNFVGPAELNFWVSQDRFGPIVAVGREQMDVYRDHPAFDKGCYIYNCMNFDLPLSYEPQQVPFAQRKHIVTFVGSLTEGKSFHVLAQAWPEVLKAVPDAELYVIGAGNLYGAQYHLGPLGIAEASYEASIMRYLAPDGKILPSVHFMGVMGMEKFKLLAQTKVGVPNPLGRGETFSLAVIEMEIMGARVVGQKCPGYLDTMMDNLFCTQRTLARAIVQLLRSKTAHYEQVRDYLVANFSQRPVVERWEALLQQGFLPPNSSLRHPFYKWKWAKEILRRLKHRYSWASKLPACIELSAMLKRKLGREQ